MNKKDSELSSDSLLPFSLYAPLYGIRWLLLLGGLLILCIFLLDLPNWFRIALLFVVFTGLLWAAFTMHPEEESKKAVVVPAETDLSRLSAERLADMLSDPMIVFDHQGTVLFANASALKSFQPLEKGTALYLRFRAPEMHALIQGVIAQKEPRSIDFFERTPIDRWYKALVKPLLNGDKEAELFVLLFRDQTETRRIDRMRSDFVANASHELRTPLASLLGFIETLQGPARDDAAARERFLQIMQKQAERMSRLIDDLLSLSRLEMRAHLAVEENVDMTALLNHIADTLTPLAENMNVTIERDLPDYPVQVGGARDELIQLFQNLVENACKYGQTGKKVIISLREQTNETASEAVASVQDFGPGIAADYLPRLTERFYRVDVETSRSQKGTGLGLAIVKHVLARHRGRLVIRSQLGEGSTFIVRLPKI